MHYFRQQVHNHPWYMVRCGGHAACTSSADTLLHHAPHSAIYALCHLASGAWPRRRSVLHHSSHKAPSSITTTSCSISLKDKGWKCLLLLAHAQLQLRPELLRDVVDEMLLRGIAPKRQTYLLVASYSLQASRFNDTMWAFDELQRHGMPLTTRDYAALVEGAGKSREAELFARITKQFEASGLEADTAYHRACLRSAVCCRKEICTTDIYLVSSHTTWCPADIESHAVMLNHTHTHTHTSIVSHTRTHARTHTHTSIESHTQTSKHKCNHRIKCTTIQSHKTHHAGGAAHQRPAQGLLGEYVRAQNDLLNMVQSGVAPGQEDFAALIRSYGNANKVAPTVCTNGLHQLFAPTVCTN